MLFIYTGKKIAGYAIAAAMIWGLTSADVMEKDDIVARPTMKVKYLGGNNDMLQFSIKYEAKSRASFKLVAISENGEVWFEDNFRVKGEFERKLSIPRLTETEYVTFLLKSARETPELSYRVRITTKVSDK